MKKTLVLFSAILFFFLLFPQEILAMNFGTIDAAKLFSQYSETQKTKNYLESEKVKLQKELDSKKKEFSELEAKYIATAKQLQTYRDNKQEAQAKKLEDQLKDQRAAVADASSKLEQYFQESQKHLYDIEDKYMGSLSKNLDTKVDSVIQTVAKAKGLEAVFEKRFCYFGGLDITEEVLAILNQGNKTAPAPKPGKTQASGNRGGK